MRSRYYYIFRIQFLGYRLHGWQKQPGLKTVESLLDKTLRFILEKRTFKILGAGRTDAMVSAQEAAFELFLYDEPLADLPHFLNLFNKNLPADIRALKIEETNSKFNVIQHAKVKEYVYLFAFGSKNHPFCAPFLATVQDDLDISLMKEGALLFEGSHNFKSYCVKPTGEGNYNREILKSEIIENRLITASFFPEETYAFHIEGSGFLRNQVRLMMGALIQLGKGEFTLDDIKNSLLPGNGIKMNYIAPASGLILNKIDFKDAVSG